MFDVGKVMYDSARADYDKANTLPEPERKAALAKVEAQRLKAHPLLEQAAAKEPGNVDFRGSLGNSWRLKAMIEKADGLRREAVADYEEAVACYDPAKHASSITDTHKEAADTLRDLKDYRAALVNYQLAAKFSDARCAANGPKVGASEFSRASHCWSGMASVQLALGETDNALKSLHETLKRREQAHQLDPAHRSMHWDLLHTRLEIMYRTGQAKKALPALAAAVPDLHELILLMKDETDLGRLSRIHDSPLSPLYSLLREQKRLPDATELLRHLIALRQRMEALNGRPTDLSKLSFGGRVSMVAVLLEQQLAAEAEAEKQAVLADAAASGSALVLAETHDRFWAWQSSQGKHADAETHARTAYDLAQQHDFGWRGIGYASDLGSSLASLQRGVEAEKILLAAWEQTAKQNWPDEPIRLRAEVALRLCSAYHNLHMKLPDAARSAATRVWVQRAAAHCPLDKFTSESDFNYATQAWMGWLAQLLDEGRAEEYQTQRTLFLQAAKKFTSPNSTLERVAKAALLLPLAGADLKSVVEGAAKALHSNSSDESLRLAHSLALLRSGQAAAALTTTAPMRKTGDSGRFCLVQVITALAHRQLGQHAEADAIIAALDKDSIRMKHINSPTQRDAIIARVLLNEARKK